MPYVGGSLTTFFNKAVQDLTAAAARDMAAEGGDHVKEITVINTPVKTGKLRSSWKRSEPTPDEYDGFPAWRVMVSTDVEYAPDVEYGTGLWGPKHAPYVIRPRNPGGTLRFVAKDGTVVFAKSVLHPGSPPNYMLAIGMNVTEAALHGDLLFRARLEKWVREVEGVAH